MLEQDFVEKIYDEIVVHGYEVYKDLYSNFGGDEVHNNTYGVIVKEFVGSLSEKQKAALFEIMRQVSVDTMSHIFGIIDGTCFLERGEKFSIVTGSGEAFSDDLQDQFLAHDEENRVLPW